MDVVRKTIDQVMVRSIHIVGIAGVFAGLLAQSPEMVYSVLAIVSGIVLVVMDAGNGFLVFVQVRGVSLYVKRILLFLLHHYPEAAIPLLISVIAISGFTSHAPSWIKYFSLKHRRVVHSTDDLLG